MSDKPLDCVGTTGEVGKHDFRPSTTEPIIHGVGQVPAPTPEPDASEKQTDV